METRTYRMLAAGAALAAAVAMPAAATTLSFGGNYSNPGGAPLVGLAVKIDSGPASMQGITGGSSIAFPTGWSQQTLASSFVAGTNPTASSSQYGFVRGGGGSTAATASATTGGVGFTASLLVDATYTPSVGDKIDAIFAFFKSDGALDLQGLYRWTWTAAAGADPDRWVGQMYVNNAIGDYPWSQFVSGTFNQLSAAVVPGSGVAALGSLGLAGVARRRRR